MHTKRVCAVHDLSCVGRCSLSVIMPILSAMGHQCCPLPTSILSTHTGGFENPCSVKLDSFMEISRINWRGEGIDFDAIFSGYASSAKQIAVVAGLFRDNAAALKLTDPVMGDDGRIYRGCEQIFDDMEQLCRIADIITPNITEAEILLGDTATGYANAEKAEIMAKKLSNLGPAIVVLTGVDTRDGFIGVTAYDRNRGQFCRADAKKVDASYPGTGDIFASVLLGALLCGDGLHKACQRAVDFVRDCIFATNAQASPKREGVLFETQMGKLICSKHANEQK
ncbi:MAG: pyridoxamine kinase [Oscillospiraceae bacterium]